MLRRGFTPIRFLARHQTKSLISSSRSVFPRAIFSTRSFSTSEGPKSESTVSKNTGQEEVKDENSSREIRKIDYDDYDDYEPRTAKEKVSYYSIVGLRLALIGLGLVCIGYTAKELFPGRMNPNSLFSDVFEYLRYKEEVS